MIEPGLTALTRMPSGELLGRGRGEVDFGCLGGGVGGARGRAHPGDRGDDDNRAAARHPKVRQPRPDELCRVPGVERERRGEVAGPGVREVAAPGGAARVGDQAVEPAEPGRDVIDGTPQRLRVRDVRRRGDDGHLVRCQPLCCLCQCRLVAGDQPDRSALRRQCLCDRKADALAAPRDQRASAAQPKLHGKRS
jgi:hypothetical protein